jgi:hypothetical protein
VLQIVEGWKRMAIEIRQAELFDYTSLDIDTRSFVQAKAQAIHARLKITSWAISRLDTI